MTREAPKQRTSADTCGHGAKTAARREQAILALLAARTLSDAATQCGVNERTLRRWMTEDPAFKAEYDRARAATFQLGLHRAQTLMGRAVDVLDALLAPTTAPAVQLGAARTIVELGLHEHDAQTILRKLTEIEQAQRSRLR